MRRKSLTLATLALATCLTLVGCSQSSQSASPSSAASPSAPAAQPTPVDCSTVKVDSDSEALPTISGESGAHPQVNWSGSKAPENLTVKTLNKGEGTEIKNGATVVVNYVGWEWDSKDNFDSSWKQGANNTTATPVAFPLAEVISGWTCGLQGTHVGDRVLMSIPGHLAYGEKVTAPPPGQEGRPSGTLVFVVDVLGGGTSEEIAAGTKDALPEDGSALADRGVTVSGELGGPATISVAQGAAEPTEHEVFVVAKGSGEALEAGSAVLTHTAGTPWVADETRKPFSTWEQKAPQLLTITEQELHSKLKGVPAGSRVVILAPKDDKTGSPAVAYVVDLEQKF